MFVTPSGISYLTVSFLPSGYFSICVFSLLNKIPFSLIYSLLLLSTFILFKLLHPENACCPIFVTPSGIVILFKLLHPPNVSCPIFVTLSGIVILSKLLHPENVASPMLITPSGIVIFFNALHLKKALSFIFVTLSGIIILFKLVQSEKAYLPIFVIPSFITTFSIISLYCVLCQSSELLFQSFISPVPDIVNVLSFNVHFAITLPSPFADISQVSSSLIS